MSMPTLQEKLESISRFTGQLIAWLSLAMVLITFLVVVLRYTLDTGWIALQESVIYLHAMNFMIGAAFTLQRDKHVRVDIFYQKFSIRSRAWVDLFGTLLLLFPVAIFIFWVSWDYVSAAWAVHEGSGEAGGLEAVYLLKSLLLVMPTLLLIQGSAWMLGSLTTLLAPKREVK